MNYDFEPYGEEWKIQVSKMTKDELIDLASGLGKRKHSLEEQIRQSLPTTLEPKPDRTQIAAMAMQGLISNDSFHENYSNEQIATHSVKVADALISELEKTKP